MIPNSITCEILYDLFFIRKEWVNLSYREKLEEENYLLSLVEKVGKDYKSLNMLLDKMIDYCLCENYDDRNNIIRFIIETKFVLQVYDKSSIYGYHLIKNQKIIGVFEAIKDESSIMKCMLACQIFSVCTRKMQGILFNNIGKYKKDIPYYSMACGIMTGAIRYDECVYNTICKTIEKSDKKELEEDTLRNPVFLIQYLMKYGYISKKELMKYDLYINKSEKLYNLIYPEYETKCIDSLISF